MVFGGRWYISFFFMIAMLWHYLESNYVDLSCFSSSCPLFTPELCHQGKHFVFLGNQYDLTMWQNYIFLTGYNMV